MCWSRKGSCGARLQLRTPQPKERDSDSRDGFPTPHPSQKQARVEHPLLSGNRALFGRAFMSAIPDLRPAVPAADAPKAIEVEHIVKKYGDFTAVDDVTFDVKEEEIFGLHGPSGAGKARYISML